MQLVMYYKKDHKQKNLILNQNSLLYRKKISRDYQL